jgi:hypothetical protein
MARLYRPHIPLTIRCEVISRQLFEMGRPYGFVGSPLPAGHRLKVMLDYFARVTGCDVKDLRLDHDPPLALRPKERRGLGRRTYYVPDANDPKYLKYRPHGAQFDGSHDVKTRIRGEHGQYSDIALIKRERRRQRREKPPTERQARMAKIREQQKELRRKIARQRKRKAGKAPKHKWQSRPFRSKKSPLDSERRND